jgi:hypothetical protein
MEGTNDLGSDVFVACERGVKFVSPADSDDIHRGERTIMFLREDVVLLKE